MGRSRLGKSSLPEIRKVVRDMLAEHRGFVESLVNENKRLREKTLILQKRLEDHGETFEIEWEN